MIMAPSMCGDSVAVDFCPKPSGWLINQLGNPSFWSRRNGMLWCGERPLGCEVGEGDEEQNSRHWEHGPAWIGGRESQLGLTPPFYFIDFEMKP